MVLLENEAFLTRLTYLYNKTRTSGTVWITMKAYNGRTKPIPRRKKKDKNALLEMEGSESKCLIRATNGKKKISTVVRRNCDTFCSLGQVVCCVLFIPQILAYLT
ncbi:signal recognition particle 14 kDa [Paramuricea clavata]|uniref:Signal recognition particle 14 kDa protein n=1 Tax=Paramuricea clavata TaxID=317549 RepID=A0A6S7FN44_PARCT|nr:signal recognition particle 14 kDa [Paramuricea clavata]